MSRYKRIAAALALCVIASAIATCGLFYGWGVPIVTIRKTQTLAGPDNPVYLLLVNRAPYDQIMAAAKSNLPGTFSFCNNGETLLGVAVDERRMDVVQGLLDLGMSPNSSGACPKSAFIPPLVAAVAREEPAGVKLLLDHGADPRLPSMFGSSAEDLAKECRNPEVKALIDAALRSTSRPSTTGPVIPR